MQKDLDRLAHTHATTVLVCLLEPHEMKSFKIPDLVMAAAAKGMIALHVPVPDMKPPTIEQAKQITALAIATARSGKNVVIHCRGGLGRAGTLGACCYVALGLAPDRALNQVRVSRKGTVENSTQEAFIGRFRKSIAQASL